MANMIDVPHLGPLRRTLLLCLLACTSVNALCEMDTPAPIPPQPPQIAIVRQSGKEDGEAQMIVKGKAHKITAKAVQAWPVREGLGALIMVLAPKGSAANQYQLRYYDLDSGRRRVLGMVPFKTGNVIETTTAEGNWVFSLVGQNLTTNQSLIFVGDDQAV